MHSYKMNHKKHKEHPPHTVYNASYTEQQPCAHHYNTEKTYLQPINSICNLQS